LSGIWGISKIAAFLIPQIFLIPDHFPENKINNHKNRRLREQYQKGAQVIITFDEQSWQTAVVMRHEPPGMWVRTSNGRFWFVTNTRRVRLQDQPTEES